MNQDMLKMLELKHYYVQKPLPLVSKTLMCFLRMLVKDLKAVVIFYKVRTIDKI